MSEKHTIIVHSVEEDGLPAVISEDEGGLNDEFDERVGFIVYNLILMGHPLPPDESGTVHWVAEDTSGEAMPVRIEGTTYSTFTGVTHWIEFPKRIYEFTEAPPRPRLRVVD